jgi:hypothetical protein
MAPEGSYVLSAGPLPPKPDHPSWMGGTEPGDLDELPHEAPTLVDRALVDVTEPMHVDDEGRLMFDGDELHPCCLERACWGHGDCTFDGFVNVPAGRSNPGRSPIPVKENWRG